MSVSFLTKMRDLIQRELRLPFFRQIDLYRIENGILIGVTGVLGMGFVIEPKDILLQADEMIADFENRTRKFLNALPEGAVLHFIARSREGDESLLKSYRDSLSGEDPLSRTLVASKVRFWRQHPFFKKELFLFVSISPHKRKTRASWLPDISIAFGKKAHCASEIEFEKTKEALYAVSGEVSEGLRSLGLGVRPMLDSETAGYLYELFNPSYSGQEVSGERLLKAVPYGVERASLRSRLLLNLPVSDYGDFYLNGYFHQGINLCALPEETTLKSIRDFEKELGRDYLLPHPLDGNRWKWEGFKFQRVRVSFARKEHLAVGYGRSLGTYTQKNGKKKWIKEEKVEDNLELAYAISVHKSQGSEFDRVYFVLPKRKTALLSPELFYTGITRASRHCTLLIEEDVAPLLKIRRPESSHLVGINTSLFEFTPAPDGFELLRREGYLEDRKIHRTLADVMVRSKSEVIISNMLFDRDIAFEYEKPLYAKDGSFYLPDFTILWRGEQFYWEHLGLLSQEEYKRRWKTKKTWYEKFFPGRLVVTEESGNLSMDAAALIKGKFS